MPNKRRLLRDSTGRLYVPCNLQSIEDTSEVEGHNNVQLGKDVPTAEVISISDFPFVHPAEQSQQPKIHAASAAQPTVPAQKVRLTTSSSN